MLSEHILWAPPSYMAEGGHGFGDPCTLRNKVQQFQFGDDYAAAVKGFQGGGIELRFPVGAGNDGRRAGLVSLIELAGQLVGTDPVHALGAEQRGHLLLLSQEGRQGGFHIGPGDMLKRECAVHVLLQVVRRGCGAEADARDVFLVVVLQLLRPFARRADAHQQHAGGQRVQRSRVAHLQVFLPEVPDGRELELADDIGRCPTVRLIHRKDNSFRVIRYVVGETHRQGILSILFWWRPPSKSVSNQARTMEEAML